MTPSHFEKYAARSEQLNDFREMVGRFTFQEEAEKHLLFYLIGKLSLSTQDDLLEIGCGPGNLLIPLSFFVRSATGIDHQNLLNKMSERIPHDARNITLLPGDFLTTQVQGRFSRILIFSVLNCLRDENEVMTFVRKAASLLRPQGIILIGDVPNVDIKEWFLSTERGKTFLQKWEHQVEEERSARTEMQSILAQEKPSPQDMVMDDGLILRIRKELRRNNVRSSLLAQPENLPFSFTREDILGTKEE